MFWVNHIWGRVATQSLWAVVFAVSLALWAQPAHAADEAYTWEGADDTTITASGGNFGVNKTTFTKTADTGGNATFTANTAYECNGQPTTGQLTITIPADKYKQAYPTEGNVTGAAAACSFTSAVIAKAGVNQVTGQPTPPGGANPEQNCDQGSFTWLFCPVIDNISSAVSNLAVSVLGPMLEVKPLSPESTPELYKTWSNIRDLAQVLFILVFFAIIAATLLQQDIAGFDQYTVKKILPRLVVASIMVQFSFLFSSLLVDVGNVLGAGISQLLNLVTDPSKGPASFTNLLGNLVTGSVAAVAGLGAIAVLASWTVALPILLSLLISLLVVFLTLGARYLILAVLVAISPLAMLAWVLPNTRDFANDWFKLLFRLILMYPLVIAIICLAGIANQILPFSGNTANSTGAAVAVALIKPLIVIAAFLIIPVSFRLTGWAVQRVHGLLTGVAQQGKGLIKGSDMFQRGLDERQRRKNTYMGRVLNSDTITSLQGKGAAGRGTAGFMSGAAALAFMRAPTNKADLQRSNSALIAKTQKNLSELKEAQNPNNLKLALAAANGDQGAKAALHKVAPELLRYASSAPGREAIFNRLVDTEFADDKDLEQFRNATPKRGLARLGASGNLSSEWRSLRDAGQAKRNQLPTIMQRLVDDKTYDVIDRAGNTIVPKLQRPRGAVDINGASKSFSKATAAELSKMSPDVFDMMRPANDPNATAFQRQAAADAALAMAIGTDPAQMAKVFNPNDRNPGAIEKKIMIAKAMQANANRDTNATNGIWHRRDYRATHSAVIKQIEKDSKMVSQLAKSTGMSDADYNALNDESRKYIVQEWMNDSNFKYTDLHRRLGGTEGIKRKANDHYKEQAKKEFFERLLVQQRTKEARTEWQSGYDDYARRHPDISFAPGTGDPTTQPPNGTNPPNT